MKKTLFFLCSLAAAAAFADLPQSITIESGNVRIRLDGKKRWNMNKIEWKDRLFGVDTPGAHYGTVYQPQNSKFFIGSGHDESGVGEKLVSLKISADDKEITPNENIVIKGGKIQIEKVSEIAGLSVKQNVTLQNDTIRELTEISAEKAVKINFLYFFMHPWSTRFDKFHAVKSNGEKIDITFKSDSSFPNREFVPGAAWYDTKSGLGVATFIRKLKGGKSPARFLWDRTSYRKDYLCDYAHSTFPSGNVVVYEAVTGFFQQTDTGKWINDAEALLKELGSEQN